MGKIDLESGIEEFESAHEFLFGVETDDDVVKTRPAIKSRYALRYESSFSGTMQIVVGTLQSRQSEYATLVTDEGVEYTLMGTGLEDREKGEVVKRTDDDRRKVGEFDFAYAVNEGEP